MLKPVQRTGETQSQRSKHLIVSTCSPKVFERVGIVRDGLNESWAGDVLNRGRSSRVRDLLDKGAMWSEAGPGGELGGLKVPDSLRNLSLVWAAFHSTFAKESFRRF